jgi:crotonobetainyl-CoA:carnitine CoA-transferase CaiB-like acyl-CoA transferase
MDYNAAFAGLKVIDLTGGVAGPSCAMMLAQHGADVIKVETPHNGGDWSRILGRTYGDHSAFSFYGTMGKRALALDLKTDKGKEVLWRLIDGADVFMEGFKPGTVFPMTPSARRTLAFCIIRFPASGRPARWPRARRWTRCCRLSRVS